MKAIQSPSRKELETKKKKKKRERRRLIPYVTQMFVVEQMAEIDALD
jgi:hypothetical protein